MHKRISLETKRGLELKRVIGQDTRHASLRIILPWLYLPSHSDATRNATRILDIVVANA